MRTTIIVLVGMVSANAAAGVMRSVAMLTDPASHTVGAVALILNVLVVVGAVWLAYTHRSA